MASQFARRAASRRTSSLGDTGSFIRVLAKAKSSFVAEPMIPHDPPRPDARRAHRQPEPHRRSGTRCLDTEPAATRAQKWSFPRRWHQLSRWLQARETVLREPVPRDRFERAGLVCEPCRLDAESTDGGFEVAKSTGSMNGVSDCNPFRFGR